MMQSNCHSANIGNSFGNQVDIAALEIASMLKLHYDCDIQVDTETELKEAIEAAGTEHKDK